MNILANFLGVGIGIALIIGLVLFLILVFEVWMFVDVIVNEALPNERKLLWLIGMVLLHPFVAIAYYFTDHKKHVI